MTPRRSVVVKAEPPQQLSPPSPAASADSQAAVTTITARRPKKRRASSSAMEEAAGKKSSWVDFTTVPYEDGYEWRKYDEKKINGTSHTRSYFRCTYRDDTGCLATKHVQQQDTSSDPPMFQVTYNNRHTCCKKNCTATTTAIDNDSRSEGVTAISCRNDHAATNIKQEQPPPVLIEVSSALPFDGAPSSMTSSCISGESWDEYPEAAGDTAAAEASAGYELLHDPELFVLCTSFKVY